MVSVFVLLFIQQLSLAYAAKRWEFGNALEQNPARIQETEMRILQEVKKMGS